MAQETEQLHKQQSNENGESRQKAKNLSDLWYNLKQFSYKYFNLFRQLKYQSHLILGISALLLLMLFYCFADQSPQPIEKQLTEELDSVARVDGVKQAVDPRARWAAEVSKDIGQLQENMQFLLNQQAIETKKQFSSLSSRIELLELQQSAANSLPLVDDDLATDDNDSDDNLKTASNDNSLPSLSTATSSLPKKRLGHVKINASSLPKNTKDYIPSISFARAVLESGFAVGTGSSAASSPDPLILRLVDMSIFSKGHHTEQIKDAMLIASCHGDISAEIAKCRLEQISFVNNKGEIVEKAVEGWIYDKNAQFGLRGIVVDKSSDMARTAVLSGMLSGMAQFFQSQASNAVYPISPLTGQKNALKAKDSLRAGAASGASGAFEKLADYAIKRAEQMNPVIVVRGGREVDVVFKKGLHLKDDELTSNLLPSLPAKGMPATNFSSSSNSISTGDNYNRNSISSFNAKATNNNSELIPADNQTGSNDKLDFINQPEQYQQLGDM